MKDNENELAWTIEIGSYTGILFGFRTYEEEEFSTHVLYIPFLDIALTIYK